MADKCLVCLLGLITLYSPFTGTSEMDDTYVFYSSGENVHLPCKNVLSKCTSTTWTYSKQSNTVELIAGGIKKKDVERHERLSLGSNCSLNIQKITEEDSGFYSCRQYLNGEQKGTDALVFLHVLQVSSSSSQSEISPGSSVTLFCQLFYDRVSCDVLVRAEGVELIWVNESGVNLQTDPRYKISFSSKHCKSSLTTRLLSEDLNREWTCLLTQRNEVKTSATYIIKYLGADNTTSEIEVSKTAGLSFRVIVIIVEVAVFAAPTVILLQIICARRAERRKTQTTQRKQ
ncbi:uncharacterized protein LOC122360169 [Puntigrus tetrazona]|uniref:uncharacterized protein LOC122360169 n=1 Tax=Puntigrus tetrazona TaxID=1606681 RepID=UPI001C8933DB|nr:uncharacterized protein LOC122360169 [Puntigrus tetrazona]